MAAVLAVAASGLLVACGGDDDGGDGDSSVVVLDEDQVKKALLTVENMPDGFVESDDDEDDEEDAPECFDALDDLGTVDSETSADQDYELDGELGLPVISSAAASYKSSSEVSDTLGDLRDAFEDCGHVEWTDDDGTETVLDFETNDERSTPNVDDQLNIVATGTISAGFEFPMGMWLSVSRVDNNVAGVFIVDMDAESGEAMLDPYTQIAVDRLVAVVNGDEPEDVQGPAIGELEGNGGESEGDDEASSFEELPLDGGSYTWETSGVTLTMTVDRLEPWGRKDDFCGDGSCGIANPDDTRVVLKYEVSVPDDASEPFDPTSCPGVMYPTSGSEEDALRETYGGKYGRSLAGKVFPGATKTGAAEYLIEKAYADQEFYIESSCGDTEYDGETAYFVGSFA